MKKTIKKKLISLILALVVALGLCAGIASVSVIAKAEAEISVEELFGKSKKPKIILAFSRWRRLGWKFQVKQYNKYKKGDKYENKNQKTFGDGDELGCGVRYMCCRGGM